MKITLEPHYDWPDRTVLLVQGNPDELDEVFDFVNANRRRLKASGFWIRGSLGWCDIHRDRVDIVRKHFCES